MKLPWNWRSKFGMMGWARWIVEICLSTWTLAYIASHPVAYSQQSAARYRITSTQVAGAMQRRQLPTKDARISLAAPITASSEDAQLEVQAMQLVGLREIRLRVACRNRADCLSFFATATYPESLDPSVVETKLDVSGAERSVQAEPTPVASRTSRDALKVPTLRSGSPVLLEMDGERLHILLQVICLQDGSAGDRIRVTTRDHKQSYVAQIVTSKLVKGSL